MAEHPRIQSVSNSMVKHAYSLTVPKKLKDSPDFLCEGFHLASEALRSDLRVRFVFATAGALGRDEGGELALAAAKAHVKVFEVPDKIIGYLSETAAPQGIVAVAAKPASRRPDHVGRCVLALYQVQDPGNVGTLMRSAEASGADGILLTDGCCDPFNPKAVRASMGSLFRLPYSVEPDWGSAMDWAREKDLHVVALVGNSPHTLADIPAERPLMLWAGSEGSGLPAELINRCDTKACIPMQGKVESLNVAVAGSLALFHRGFGRPLS